MNCTLQKGPTCSSEAAQFTEKALLSYQVKNKRQVMHATMLVEDFVEMLYTNDPQEGNIKIRIVKHLGDISVRILADGKSYNPLEELREDLELDVTDEVDQLKKLQINILRAYKNNIVYRRGKNSNILTLSVETGQNKLLYINLAAFAVAILLGLVLRYTLTPEMMSGLSKFVLNPVKDIFMRLLKFVMVPVVFFSIITCVFGFNNIHDLGRLGLKTMGLYTFTSFLAVAIGIGFFYLLQPAGGNIVSGTTTVVSGNVEVSFVNMIVDIFPSNLVRPFIEGNMLQLIFLGFFLGTGLSAIGSVAKPVRDICETCNQLFSHCMSVIVKFLPIVTVATITSIVMQIGADVLISLLGLIGTYVVSIAAMYVCYGLIAMIMGKKNPLILLKKLFPLMLTAFSLSSSNATIPVSMETCEKRLGVSPKVSSFTIPLGATVNMDSTCIYLALSSLFLAKIYNVAVTGEMLISLSVLVLSLSIGLPGVPGAGLVGLSMIILQLGIPVEAIGLLMGIDRLAGMLRCAGNVVGDAAVTVVVAKTENLLDDAVYDGK